MKPKEPRSPIPSKFSLINGVPYYDCGNCKQIVRMVDGDRQRISIVVDWEQEDVYSMVNGVLTMETKWKPVVIQRPGCFTCWNTQQQAIVRYGSHLYGMPNDNRSSGPIQKVDSPISKCTTIYRKKEEYTVVHNGAVNTYQGMSTRSYQATRRHEERSTEKKHKESLRDLYGPYGDRKGK